MSAAYGVTRAATVLCGRRIRRRRQESGCFIQVTSTGGRLTAPGLAACQSAKFAVEGFSGVWRQQDARWPGVGRSVYYAR
jgi:NAD(P)-dependent dehydrogenase (short-subunit alcohol dehydrogenase family)